MISVNSSNTMVTIISPSGTLKAMSNRVIRIIDMIVIMIMVILSFRYSLQSTEGTNNSNHNITTINTNHSPFNIIFPKKNLL